MDKTNREETEKKRKRREISKVFRYISTVLSQLDRS